MLEEKEPVAEAPVGLAEHGPGHGEFELLPIHHERHAAYLAAPTARSRATVPAICELNDQHAGASDLAATNQNVEPATRHLGHRESMRVIANIVLKLISLTAKFIDTSKVR